MATILDLLRQQEPQNRLAGYDRIRQDSGAAQPLPMGQMPQGGPQMAAQANLAPQAPAYQPQPQTAPQGGSGGAMGVVLNGIGDFVGNLLMPDRAGRNQTIQWLQGQGMDEGMATMLASNKPALQQFLLQRVGGSSPEDMLKLEKLGLEVEQMRNPTTDDVREYQFARQQGYEGTFADWRNSGSAKPSAIQEYEYAKQQGFPGTFQDWEASKKGGMSLQIDPATGAVTFQQGGNIKPMTEAQSKDTVYATRAEGALPILDQYGEALTNPVERAAEYDPTGIARGAQSPEYQQARQAGDEFLQAILRKDTGAAITKDEMESYGRTYLPRPGDGPEVLDQKRRARARALAAMKAGMPPQAILAQEKALSQSSQDRVGREATPPAQDGGWSDTDIPGVRIRRKQ